jgi:hypothetical protein
MPEKSKGHRLFVGNWEYLMVGDALHRANISRTFVKGVRPSELWVGAPAAEFALRAIRLQAGLREK